MVELEEACGESAFPSWFGAEITMESLITTYKGLLISPEAVPSVPGFLLATLELLVAGMVIGWFVAHVAKMLINGEQLGISNRISLTVCWAAITLAVMAMLDVTVLLILDRVPGWSAVSPHAAFALIMGIIALVYVVVTRTELRRYRVYVETARKQGS